MWTYVLVAVVVAIAAEALLTWLCRRPAYELRDTEISLGLAFGWLISGMLNSALALWVIGFTYDHRLAQLGGMAAAPLIVVLLADLLYYGWHRLSHRLGWMWATHYVHHTVRRMNVLASLRQGWTDALSGTWLTWAPLGLLGFSPQAVAPYFVLLLVWEAFIHNGWTPRLGPLEWLLVTPSNHRVHHSLAPQHLDRNFGGVLIAWDRLFGTYAAEGAQRLTAFGVAGESGQDPGPLEIATRQWRAMVFR